MPPSQTKDWIESRLLQHKLILRRSTSPAAFLQLSSIRCTFVKINLEKCATYCFGSQLALAFLACVHCSTAIAPCQFRSAMLPMTPPNICVSPGDTGAQGCKAPLRAPFSSCPVFPQGAAGKHILDNGRAQIQPSSVIHWFSAQTARNISTYLNCRQIKHGLVRLHFPSLILCCLLWGQREGHKEGSCKNLHVPL